MFSRAAFAAPYETLLGEAVGTARGQADDPAPGRSARSVSSSELGDHQRRPTCVDGEDLVEGFGRKGTQGPVESIDRGLLEGVRDPSARVIDQDVDRSEPFFGEIEGSSRRRRVGEVGLDRDGVAGLRLDLGKDASSVFGAQASVSLVIAVGCSDAKVGDQNAGAGGGERLRDGGAYPVIGAGDDGDMACKIEVTCGHENPSSRLNGGGGVSVRHMRRSYAW